MLCGLKRRASHACITRPPRGSVTPVILFSNKKDEKEKKKRRLPMTQLWACARGYALGEFERWV